MECEEIKKLLSEYIDDTLDMHRKRLIEEHLATCKACSEELVSLKAYIKELSSLKEVEAPEDFLEKVHERVEQRFKFEKIMRKLFFPIRIKVPLKLVAVVATVLLAIAITYVIQPIRQILYVPLAPETVIDKKERVEGHEKLEFRKRDAEPADVSKVPSVSEPVKIGKKRTEKYKELALEKGVAKPEAVSEKLVAPPSREEKPIELALLIRPEEPAITRRQKQTISAKRPAELEERKIEEVERTRKALIDEEAIDKDKMVLLSPYLNEALSKVKNLIELVEGKVISVEYEKETNLPQYITTQIPAVNYGTFLEKLGQIAGLQKPPPSEAARGKKSLRLRIKLILFE